MNIPSVPERLAAILGQVRRPGDFYATGTIDIHPPRLEVEGVGPIALPLLPAQAEQIIAMAERAPYGRGTETLVDTDVHRTWQVGADQVRISGKVWEQDLSTMVAQAAAGLGVTGQVEAELYKLLVYDAGSFFVRHRDSEKTPGMFATLVVVLPSDFSGGELLVRHKGYEVRLDLRREEPSEAAFAAFYADCLHEVLPVVSGHRLALIYNLIRRDSGPVPKPPDYESEQQQVASLLHEWTSTEASAPGTVSDSDSAPTKLIYPLEHAYTQAELGFSSLKGADAAVASVMLEAAYQADWEVYLALVSIAESGWAEIPFLGELVRQCQATGSGREDPNWQEAHRLAAQIRRNWPEAAWARQQASRAGRAEALLRHLADLGDLGEIDAFLAERAANGAYGSNDNEALTAALSQLSPTRIGELLTAIITHNTPTQPAACANLLARWAAASTEPTALGQEAATEHDCLQLQLLSGSEPIPRRSEPVDLAAQGGAIGAQPCRGVHSEQRL